MIVVIDSGVWISAIEFGGTPAKALELVAQVDELAMCSEIEDEVLRILRGKFGRNPASIRTRMTPFWNSAIRVEVTGQIQGVSRDLKDDFVIECAVKARADILVSGDNDLLSLKNYGKVRILTARQYITEQTDVKDDSP